MFRKIIIALVALGPLMFASAAVDDPYALGENTINPNVGLWFNNHGFSDTTGRTLRNTPINIGVKNLVLILPGQSLAGAEAPTAFVPTNSTVVDNLNPYDGSIYAYVDPPLGSTWAYTSFGGSLPTPSAGAIGGRIADTFITNGTFARVIVVPIASGSSQIFQWNTGGIFADRIGVAMRRLAARGITPATTNVTFAVLWMQGESDHGTATATYKTGLTNMQAQAVLSGFSGRFFVSQETWISGATDTNVQAAQTGIVDGVKFWAGGNIDSLNATNRLADNTHLNDTGMAAAAALQVAAMHASGSPF